jgi:hypothetical protein
MSQRKAARIAGIAWIIVIITGLFAEFYIRMRLIVPGDAAATAKNISEMAWLFRSSVVSDIFMLAFDAVVALALFMLLKAVHKSLALLALIFRMVMNVILGVNLVNLMIALQLSNGTMLLTLFNMDQLHALSSVFLNAHSTGYDISLVFFGIHLFIVGYLIYKSSHLPKVLGILLFSASLGYVIDSFAGILLSSDQVVVTVIASILIAVAVIAELSLSVWLIWRAPKIPEPTSG